MTDFNSLKTESRNLKSADIDKMSALEIAQLINEEDKTVAFAVTEALESIARGIDAMADALKNGGRIFYIGAGTSGRLGVLDASECPPTYGVSADTVIGIIAGGRDAAFESIEDAEDDFDSCVKQMKEKGFCGKDVCVGLSASGSANCVKERASIRRFALGKDDFGLLQPQFSPASALRHRHHGRGRAGGHQRLHPNEGGHGAENDPKYALHRRDGSLRTHARELHGVYDPLEHQAR